MMTRWLSAGLLCLALWPAAAQDQFSRTKEIYAQVIDNYSSAALRLYGEGRRQEAISSAAKGLAISEREFGRDHPNTASSLDTLATLYRAESRHTV